MLTTLIEGFILGISTGTLCLVTCTPIYIPYLMSEDRKFGRNFIKVFEISAGRFFSYIAFGALAGFLGGSISYFNREIFTSIAYILISIFLILSAVRTRKKSKSCHVPKFAKFTSSAFLLGIITGINFCPSFLIALSKAIDLAGPLSGVMLFLGFFFGTTIYLIPLGFLGGLAKIKKLAFIAQISSVLIAVYFIFAGIQGLYHIGSSHDGHDHVADNISAGEERMIDVYSPYTDLKLISSSENIKYFTLLQDSILLNKPTELIGILTVEKLPYDSLKKYDKSIFFIDSKLLIASNGTNYDSLFCNNFDYIKVDNNYPIKTITTFLQLHTFKVVKPFYWKFEN
ncbi:MAG: hypothetical protein GQ534_07050 [Candidatus Delongbacteria bacterium]|nr:hypothetical protein [Candidatus Delongbacteria bacterium]